jgi:hypothetical protein
MLKASAPQKRMRRGSWCLDVLVLDHRIIDHLGKLGRTTAAVDGLTCRKRRNGIGGLAVVDLRFVEVRLDLGSSGR